MKALRITSCSDPLMWYADKVGKCVLFVREQKDCYMSREDEGYVNIVRFEDAEVVECCNGVCNQGRDCPMRI